MKRAGSCSYIQFTTKAFLEGRMRRKKTPTFERIKKAWLKNAQEIEVINRMCDRQFLERNAEVFERHFSRIQKFQGYREMVN